MNKTFTLLLVLVTMITFASATALAGSETYIPHSAEVDRTGWIEVDQPDRNISLEWLQNALGGANGQDDQASMYIPYSAEVDPAGGNDEPDLPTLVWEKNTLLELDSQGDQASIYIPCSAEVTSC